MPARFFLDDPPAGDAVRISGELAAHLGRSLRMRVADVIVAVHDGLEYGVALTLVAGAGGDVEGVVRWSRPVTGEPALQVTLLQALPRERMEDCIDVAVQAGVAAIVPVVTERVVSRPDEARVAARVRRWNAVAREAAQLAGRGRIPDVQPPTPLADALARLPGTVQLIACTSGVDVGGLGRNAPPRPLGSISVDRDRPVALVIGPEGGLGERDLAAVAARGATSAHLGPRILRTRYAGAVATALLLATAGDLDTAMTETPV